MRKRLTKSTFTGITVIITAIMMALCMTACGTAIENTYTFKNLASKEGVFEVRDLELDLGLEEAKHYNISNMQLVEDTIYMLVSAYYSDRTCILHYTVDLQGNVLDSSLIHDNFDEVYRDARYSQLLADGSVVYIEIYETGGRYVDLYNYDLVCCDRKGQEIRRIMLAKKEKWSLFRQILEEKENHMILISDSLIYEVNYMDGTVEKWAAPELVKDESIYMTEQGLPYIILYGEDYSVKSYRYIDLHSGELLGEHQSTQKFKGYTTRKYENSDYDYVLEDAWGMYWYQEETGEILPILDYINSDIYFEKSEEWRLKKFIDSDHFLALQRNMANPERNNRLLYCSRVAPEDVPDREAVILAITDYFSRTLRKQIVEFNKSSDRYRICVDFYDVDEFTDASEQGLEELQEAIASEQGPDIISVSKGFSPDRYARQGTFTDFYELIDKDKKVKLKDFTANVFQAYEVDGKLYELPVSFYIQTAVGKLSVFGENTDLSWEEFDDILAQYPDAVSYGELTREEVLRNTLQFAYPELVDEETGQCYFDSEQFKQILEFAGTFPEDVEEMLFCGSVDYLMLAGTDYSKDRILLLPVDIYDMNRMREKSFGYFWEATTPAGYPNGEGIGSTVKAYESYVIPADSDCIEGAWEFVKSLLSEEAQSLETEEKEKYYGESAALPVLKKVLKRNVYGMMDDVDAENAEEEGEYDISVSDNVSSVKAATRKEARMWFDFICSVNRKTGYTDEHAVEIICEHAENYFDGKKSVDEVAAVIQKEMLHYLMEN